ncbi:MULTISPECIES: excisionase family DNA-binding protein [Flavobacterium]|uniref:excisionase family DNA-binding protein n=1 Tax=Flavobacterium TaxID=237 RepID=UPI001FCC62DF|nr:MULTISPECIES: excisionase family DNA-binding protein [Flavobacterium]UOK42117.1 excisionase family DNA-binding protein [Flavobacterium enshiense]
MENPFELILERLDRIERAIERIKIPEQRLPVNELMDLKEVTAYLKSSSSAIYKLTSSNGIPHYKNGRKVCFKKSEIDDWVFSKRIKTMDEIEAEAMEYIRNSPRFISLSKQKK